MRLQLCPIQMSVYLIISPDIQIRQPYLQEIILHELHYTVLPPHVHTMILGNYNHNTIQLRYCYIT